MKLAILGGGGFRTPFVWQALLRDQGEPRITAVTLQDADASRLAGMRAVLEQLAEGFPEPPALQTTTNLDVALEGSDFVFSAVRVGGLAGRCADERVALDLGVLGQETTGPGGLAYALRTVPFMVDVAERVARLAPDAYVLNFTNPAGIITEAMQGVLGDKVLGICDTPSGLGRRVATLLGHDPDHARLDYVGLNHLGWLRRVEVHGRDVLPDLLGDDGLLAHLEEQHVFGAPWLKALGAIPNEYLYYWYRNAEAVARIRESSLTRGEFLLKTQGDFFDQLPRAGSRAAQLWRETVLDRSASYMAEAKGGEQGAPENPEPPETDPSQQGYAGVALAVMAAISRDEPSTAILNVRNGATIAGLPSDAVVEVPVAVDGSGVRPFATPAPDLHQLGLMQQVKAVERHVIAAALHGDETEALLAFATHPLVRSVDVAEKLLAGYVEKIPEVAAVFGRS
ncbi:6-phospho-beta-glucosidase [Kineococcus rhizosphaerae]|uniref:6-phospho-beta-glucosidase n=1 Tax=Kineococcus rhizosphaerae TaxID=559628 RepID=A0A2T0R3L6_9ACTN|nr:6-phospho-beta-glucosidase [Kineococcus rhizosphaerae]PRY14600.1 6-phospho-beta-glucosidase [Kineococcus rhizosphaerae]